MTDEGKREFRNRVLIDMLTTGPVPEFEWTEHAKQRVRELIAQGFKSWHLGGVRSAAASVAWGEKYGSPVLRYREWAVPLEITHDGRVIAVTALPSCREEWKKVLDSGLLADGRTEIRI